MSRNRYGGDPRWIVARFPGKCATCGATIRKGDRCYYRPNGRHVYCEPGGCAAAQEADFTSRAFDEDMAPRAR
jgi:hypothetical protein